MRRHKKELPFQKKQISGGVIKNNICSCKENSGTKQQTSGGRLKYLYSCKWRGGVDLDEHLVCRLFAWMQLYLFPPQSGIHSGFQYLLNLSVSLIYSVYLLSVWLCGHLITYPIPYLPFCILSLSGQVCTCVPYYSSVGIAKEWGGYVDGHRGFRVLVKRQPGNSPQRLSLKPPLLHLTLCPGSPDKPTTHTHIHLHKCTHKHTQTSLIAQHLQA